MLNRLTKSAEVQMQVDDEYFKINMEGHQTRLKLENTLKNCHQVGTQTPYLRFLLGHLALTGHLFSCFYRSCRSSRNSELKFCTISSTDITSTWPALGRPWNTWEQIYEAIVIISKGPNTLLLPAGPKTDRTGSPKRGHGQGRAHISGGKQHHNWGDQNWIADDGLFCESVCIRLSSVEFGKEQRTIGRELTAALKRFKILLWCGCTFINKADFQFPFSCLSQGTGRWL